jgi:alpha-1,2-glucosyltransferase
MLEYYKGNYKYWDPKITTPPGLYLSSLFLNLNSLAGARAINLIYSFGVLLTLYSVTRKDAYVIALFPISFFYSFLYYTDMGSLFYVLLGFKFGRTGHFKCSALSYLIAILFRQTNIIWMLFVAGLAVVDLLRKKNIQIEDDCNLLITLAALLKIITTALLNSIKHFHYLISYLYPYVLVLVTFGIFIVINGSIVLGDKANHEARLHIPQFYYFFLVTFGFGIFAINPLRVSRAALQFIRNNVLFSLCNLIFIWYTVANYTYSTINLVLHIFSSCQIIAITHSIFGGIFCVMNQFDTVLYQLTT